MCILQEKACLAYKVIYVSIFIILRWLYEKRGRTNSTTSMQVIDRMALALDIIAQYDDTVSLKIIPAESGLHS